MGRTPGARVVWTKPKPYGSQADMQGLHRHLQHYPTVLFGICPHNGAGRRVSPSSVLHAATEPATRQQHQHSPLPKLWGAIVRAMAAVEGGTLRALVRLSRVGAAWRDSLRGEDPCPVLRGAAAEHRRDHAHDRVQYETALGRHQRCILFWVPDQDGYFIEPSGVLTIQSGGYRRARSTISGMTLTQPRCCAGLPVTVCFPGMTWPFQRRWLRTSQQQVLHGMVSLD